MKIIYKGPSPFVLVGGSGPHNRDEVKDYPDDVGRELLETAKRQRFEAVEPETGKKETTDPKGEKGKENGDTKDGKGKK